MNLNGIQQRALHKVIGEMTATELEKRFQLTDEEQDELDRLYVVLEALQPTLPSEGTG
jgi:hypothetical protein